MSLYIVSTPIGNLQDITLRAIETLKSVDLVACEDTRVTGGLLHHLEISKKMISLNDANEENKIYELIELLESGKSIALVSDAGTPLISDPGFKLVRAAIQKGIRVVPIPGASAVTAALSAADLPTDKFLFMGFSPDSLAHKITFFQSISNLIKSNDKINPTIVFYESPHKLLKSLDAMLKVYGDIDITIAREMTKIHEEFLKDKITILLDHFTKTAPRGEFVILFKILP